MSKIHFLSNFQTCSIALSVIVTVLYVTSFCCVLSHVWLCAPNDCSPKGSSIHGIFQARILEWVAISYSRGLSLPRDWTYTLVFPALAGRFSPLCYLGSPHYISKWGMGEMVKIVKRYWLLGKRYITSLELNYLILGSQYLLTTFTILPISYSPLWQWPNSSLFLWIWVFRFHT